MANLMIIIILFKITEMRLCVCYVVLSICWITVMVSIGIGRISAKSLWLEIGRDDSICFVQSMRVLADQHYSVSIVTVENYKRFENISN